jgi:Asp-tRNA(Asn)/Glu-tRNA(Gln) amidotransferase C subunit
MSDNLPARLRNILSRRTKVKTEEQVEAFIDDLEQIIRAVEQVQMDVSREMLRRRE